MESLKDDFFFAICKLVQSGHMLILADLMTVLGLGGSSISASGSNDTSNLGRVFNGAAFAGLAGFGAGSAGGAGASGGGGCNGSSTMTIFFRVLGALSFAPAGRPAFFFGSAAGCSTIGAGGSIFSVIGSTIGSTIASAILHYCTFLTTIDEQLKNCLL